MLAKSLEIEIECAHEKFLGVLGIPVAPKIQCDTVKILGQRSGDMIPPMRIRPPSVEQNDAWLRRFTPAKSVEGDARA